MIIQDDELLKEFTDFLLNSEGTYVEDRKTDYFTFIGWASNANFKDWLAELVRAAIRSDKFESDLPNWCNIDLSDARYESLLYRSLLNDPTSKNKLLDEFQYLKDIQA